MELRDQYNRVADYLRIGVTDRCNLRCRYCMPEEGIDFANRAELLTYEELLRLAGIFRELGVNKVRLTGGEPFVRKDIAFLLRGLADLFPKVHITTNATLLQNHISLLQEIEVGGLNISIDSLDKDKFFLITRRDSYDLVMSNIKNCLSANLPVKLNMVVMKGVNDNEIVDFLHFGLENRVEVRFIEAMPFNEDDGNKSVFMPSVDIFKTISASFPNTEKLLQQGISSSEKYALNNDYQFGIIPAYSRSLCGFCNRIRLTPQGEFMTCLYATKGLDLRELIRNEDLTNDDIRVHILNAVHHKKKDGFEEEKFQKDSVFRSMTTIGG